MSELSNFDLSIPSSPPGLGLWSFWFCYLKAEAEPQPSPLNIFQKKQHSFNYLNLFYPLLKSSIQGTVNISLSLSKSSIQGTINNSEIWTLWMRWFNTLYPSLRASSDNYLQIPFSVPESHTGQDIKGKRERHIQEVLPVWIRSNFSCNNLTMKI